MHKAVRLRVHVIKAYRLGVSLLLLLLLELLLLELLQLLLSQEDLHPLLSLGGQQVLRWIS